MTVGTGRPVRFTILANPRTGIRDQEWIDASIRRARAAEAQGYDIVSYADWAVGDVFPALVLLAQATERVGLMTRITGAPIRSPLLLASGAAWVDRVSGGRFLLGLGASTANEVEGRHGIPFRKPAAYMADTLSIIRGLYGEAVPGVEHLEDGSIRYAGPAIQVSRSRVDLLPGGRVPLIVAASGPRMLRAAGALADGVIVELGSPTYVRWAWDQVREGAAAAGRQLPDDFELCFQTQFYVETDAEPHASSNRFRVNFMISHCVMDEFRNLWVGGGLDAEAGRVREAVARGDRAAAERVVLEEMLPRTAVFGTPDQIPERFFAWLESVVEAGVTMITLPLELPELFGITLDDVRRSVGLSDE